MREARAPRPFQVLLVEDNADDVELTRLGFARARVPVHLHAVGDGPSCLAFLRRQPPYGDAPAPDLVLLDVNLPRMDGCAVLAAIVADPALRRLPVVVLTTSTSEQDVRRMYDLRCSAYLVKPLEFPRFLEMVEAICTFWFSVVRLPGRT